MEMKQKYRGIARTALELYSVQVEKEQAFESYIYSRAFNNNLRA